MKYLFLLLLLITPFSAQAGEFFFPNVKKQQESRKAAQPGLAPFVSPEGS